MNKPLLIPMNLQFFAEEGVSENTSEVAEPTEDVATEDSSTSTEGEGTTENTETEPSNVQSDEDNAKFAAARRRAEAEFNQKQQALDAEFARRFEGYENPITHEPIRNQKDYFAALDAQEKLARDKELQDKGIDPKVFEDMVNRQVNNNPIVQQAQEVLNHARQSQLENTIAEGLREISTLDPNIKTIDDILNLPNAQQIIGYTKQLSLVDAYKLANFDSLMQGKVAGAKQAALNNINGTAHLNQTDNIAPADNGEVEIPQSELAQWKRAFPNATHAELRKKYNSTL